VDQPGPQHGHGVHAILAELPGLDLHQDPGPFDDARLQILIDASELPDEQDLPRAQNAGDGEERQHGPEEHAAFPPQSQAEHRAKCQERKEGQDLGKVDMEIGFSAQRSAQVSAGEFLKAARAYTSGSPGSTAKPA
jgi:hypothetical protein